MTQLAGSPKQIDATASGGGETSTRPRALLFCSFEPSGDDHASTVIAELIRRHPDLKIYAWGGPRMAAAGVPLLDLARLMGTSVRMIEKHYGHYDPARGASHVERVFGSAPAYAPTLVVDGGAGPPYFVNGESVGGDGVGD